MQRAEILGLAYNVARRLPGVPSCRSSLMFICGDFWTRVTP